MYLEERGSHCGRIDAAVFAPIVKNLDSGNFLNQLKFLEIVLSERFS